MKRQHIALRLFSLLDQALFSAANFVMLLTLARNYTDAEVAGFGIGLSIALIIQSVQRNCYLVQNAVLMPAIFRRRARKVLGEHCVILACILAAEILIALFLYALDPSPYHRAIMLACIACSLLYAQLDFDRMALTKFGRGMDSFLASLAFLGIALFLFRAVPAYSIGFESCMAVICLFTMLKVTRLAVLIGLPDLTWGVRLAYKHIRRNLPSSVLGVAGYAGHSHGPLFILGLVAAPAQSAAFVAMRGLMQPMMIIIRSMDVIDKNLFHLGSADNHAALRKTLFLQSALYGALSCVAVLASIFWGDWITALAYGEKYAGFSHVLTGWTLFFALVALMLPLETVIAKRGLLNRYNGLRLLAGITGMLSALALCPAYGATGAIYACVAGGLVAVACGVWLVRDVIGAKHHP